jgi:hypothetical protein
VSGAAGRRHTDFFTLKIGSFLNRRPVEYNHLCLGDLRCQNDLHRYAVSGDADGIGRRRSKGKVDGIGNDRASGSVNFGKLHPFNFEPLFLGQFHLLQNCAESQAKSAGPITHFNFLSEQLARHESQGREYQRENGSAADQFSGSHVYLRFFGKCVQPLPSGRYSTVPPLRCSLFQIAEL